MQLVSLSSIRDTIYEMNEALKHLIWMLITIDRSSEPLRSSLNAEVYCQNDN